MSALQGGGGERSRDGGDPKTARRHGGCRGRRQWRSPAKETCCWLWTILVSFFFWCFAGVVSALDPPVCVWWRLTGFVALSPLLQELLLLLLARNGLLLQRVPLLLPLPRSPRPCTWSLNTGECSTQDMSWCDKRERVSGIPHTKRRVCVMGAWCLQQVLTSVRPQRCLHCGGRCCGLPHRNLVLQPAAPSTWIL